MNPSIEEVDLSMNNFANAASVPRIKEEVTNIDEISTSNHLLDSVTSQQMDLHSDTIEYIPNELDDSNIQGKSIRITIVNVATCSFYFYASTVVNVYTTHMPEISSTLPTIIMQDEPSINTSNSSRLLPSEQPPYSLLGDDILKHSFSDDACSSDDRSDIEIDI